MQHAGLFNRYVEIQQRASTEDAYGEVVGTWSVLSTDWAWIKSPTGASAASEAIEAGRAVSSVTVSIRLNRLRTNITAGMRVVDGAVTYEIRAVLPDYAGSEFTDLVCERGASEG
jgi:SPP1 family predicted phage head-tail adaptor